jgi:hypothetical protein
LTTTSMKPSTVVALLLLRLCASEASTARASCVEGTTHNAIPFRGGLSSRWSSSSTTLFGKRRRSIDDLLALRGGHSSSSSTIGSGLTSFAKTNPVLTAFLSCAINGLAADWVAQRSEASSRRAAARREAATDAVLKNIRPSGAAFVNSHNNMTTNHHYDDHPVECAIAPSNRAVAQPAAFQWDPKRSLAFVLYGGCYQGMACHAFYNVLFLRWFGPGRVWTKVAVSQFIMAPLLTLPCAYLFKGMVFGRTAAQTLEDYWTGVAHDGLLFSFWKLWMPVQFLIFAVIPTHLRIPFSSFFSFLWTVILSLKTS